MKQSVRFTIYKKQMKTKDGRKFYVVKSTYDKANGSRVFLDVKLSKENQAKLDVQAEVVGGYPISVGVDEYWLFKQENTKNYKLVFKDFYDVRKEVFATQPQKEVSVDELE